MSKASGIVLILAGLAVGTQAMPWIQGPAEPEIEIAQIPPPLPSRVAAAPQPIAKPEERATPAIVPPKPQPAARPATPAMATLPPVVVAPPQRDAHSASAARPVIPDRAGLARELQRELKRVGCYDGDLTGTWTPGTKRAMKAFTDRVNATLPVDQPDYILLTLVQGHQDAACGKGCPASQSMTEEGRCVPNAILARAKKSAPPAPAVASVATKPAPAPERPQPVISGWSTTTAAATPPPDGRMSLAGPKVDNAPPVLGAPLRVPDAAARDEIQPQVSKPVRSARPPERRPPPPRQARSRDWIATMYRRLDNSR